MKTKQTFTLVITLALFSSLTSCWEDFSVNGNGIPETEERWAPYFDEISSSGSFNVYVVPGDEFHIEVNAEYNLLPYIVTDIDGDKLKIRTSGINNLHNHLPMEVFVTTPHLNNISLSGSGYMNTGSFEGEHLRITVSGSGEVESMVDVQQLDTKISGSGKIKVSGSAVKTDMNISGSGKIFTYNLIQQYCWASISGSGDLYVNVEKILDVKISGSGDVLFVNTPEIHSKISGSGKIINDN